MHVTPEEVVLDVLRARNGEFVKGSDLAIVASVKGVGEVIKTLRDQGHDIQGIATMGDGPITVRYRLVKEAE